MKRGASGSYQTDNSSGEAVRAFIPYPLPPDPALELTQDRLLKLEQATLACGRLDAVASFLPDPDIFLYAYVRREAVLSSQIEGTQSSLSDLLMFELRLAPGVPLDDAAEVSRYVTSLNHGLTRLREGFPLCNRLLREIHGALLSRGRGAEKQPGEFRRSQNWIGGSRPGIAFFVPPPPSEVESCMADLERFVNLNEGPPALLKAALAHVQFETVHPFLDGNGRLGRLLISLILQQERVLHQPLLYLSLYFKQNRPVYYRLLDAVRTDGDWEAWVDFFLDAVICTANSAVEKSVRLRDIFERDQRMVQTLGRRSATTIRVLQAFRHRPLATIGSVANRLHTSFPAVSRAVDLLVEARVLVEVTGRSRDRVYAYRDSLAVLNEDTVVRRGFAENS